MLKKSLDIAKKGKGFFQGLLGFLKQYSVIGLAIGVIAAQASKDLIDALVKGIFTPIIKLIVPTSLADLTFTIHGQIFDIGIILNSALTFFIIMAFLYFIIKAILRNDSLLEK